MEAAVATSTMLMEEVGSYTHIARNIQEIQTAQGRVA